MKKVFYFLASAMICVAMAACNGNAENTDIVNNDSINIEQDEVNAPVNNDNDNDARLQAIHEAAMKICDNCDGKEILNCVNAVIDESFDQFKEDADFKAAVQNEATECLKEKAKNAAIDEGKKAAKEGAKKGVEEGLKALKK
ncbi:MAG: hypothetical protein J6X58_02550 [Bacteroidales bacterium]|nr:hypothetical protein [Bacteroidales bacterium]